MIKNLTRPALAAALALQLPAAFAGVTLTADGRTDTYQLIRSKLNSTIEAPDCSHSGFGPHITQAHDSALGKPVFVFHAHVHPDDDRCLKSDRQRNEIKVDAQSPAGLRAVQGDRMTYEWKFRLDSGFQASPSFTHLHQVKPVGGDDDMPLMTLIARGGSADALELTQYDYSNQRRVLKSVPLSLLRGEWVQVRSNLTAGRPGRYAITLTRVRDGATLLSYSASSIDMWRSGVQFLRPKWGIYRSLGDRDYLRDEQVRFDGFCIAKGGETCGGSDGGMTPAPAPAPAPQPGGPTALVIDRAAVTASAHDGNLPANSVDGNTGTRWSAQGDGQWIQYDLKAQRQVGLVRIAWHNGNTRRARFEIQLSSDGRAFTTVHSGESSGITTGRETYDFPDASARYVRIVGHGNSSNQWNSIAEAEVHGLD
ncbi:MAG TPA: discoidin domain-containing protein [Moraxellaceae bacterium]|nr:discoidin domain-containing protein [Moraxellaceae bacterium]